MIPLHLGYSYSCPGAMPSSLAAMRSRKSRACSTPAVCTYRLRIDCGRKRASFPTPTFGLVHGVYPLTTGAVVMVRHGCHIPTKTGRYTRGVRRIKLSKYQARHTPEATKRLQCSMTVPSYIKSVGSLRVTGCRPKHISV